MKIPNLIWSSCVVTNEEGSTSEMGHCWVKVDGRTLRVDEDSPRRTADGTLVGGDGVRSWLYGKPVLLQLDHRGATFTAEGWSSTYAKDGSSTSKTWPVVIVLTW